MAEDEIELISTEDAVAEVRRWLEAEGVDPEGVFTAFGDRVIRYKDLIPLLQADADDAELLRFAISRGRAMRPPGRRRSSLLQIPTAPPAAPPGAEEGED
jgi:hypothetical protein